MTPASSLGIQSSLNSIASAGGGTLTLSGSGSVLVTDPLIVGNNTTLRGDPARTPYGMIFVGENTPGYGYRINPIINIPSKNNVTIYNLDFEGAASGRLLCAPAIDISSSSTVMITYNLINGARTRGITARSTSYLTTQYLTLNMSRKSGSEPEGGVALWCVGCQYASIKYNAISSVDYFNSGPPTGDSRAGTTPPGTAAPITDPRGAVPVMDMIAFYDGPNNTFSQNTLSYGNTAAIYLAPCSGGSPCTGAGESNDVIWDNTIRYFRQHGLDIHKCSGCAVLTNRIDTYVELANVNLAALTCGDVKVNDLQNGGKWVDWFSAYGSLTLAWSTNNCHNISSNYIKGSNNPYSVYFYSDPTVGSPSNNTISGNNIWSGSSGYFGGNHSGWDTSFGNSFGSNTLH